MKKWVVVLLIISVIVVVALASIILFFVINQCDEKTQYKSGSKCIEYSCLKDSDCNDNNQNTIDSCIKHSVNALNLDNICRNKLIVCKEDEYLDMGQCKKALCLKNSDCEDDNNCTIDECKGSIKDCSHSLINECKSRDGCCPASCDSSDDLDCGFNQEINPVESCLNFNNLTFNNGAVCCDNQKLVPSLNTSSGITSGYGCCGENECHVHFTDLSGYLCASEGKVEMGASYNLDFDYYVVCVNKEWRQFNCNLDINCTNFKGHGLLMLNTSKVGFSDYLLGKV